MKTAKEIKKGLACCSFDYIDCEQCPYRNDRSCKALLNMDAFALIGELEMRIARGINVLTTKED